MNPANEMLRLSIAGNFRVGWYGGTGAYPVDVDLVVAQRSLAGALTTIYTNTVSKPHNTTNFEFLDVTARTAAWANPGDSLLISLRAKEEAQGYWVTLDDLLSITVEPITPLIKSHPQSRTVTEGSSVQLEVVAQGVEPLRYQWQKGGVDMPGFTDSVLTLFGVYTNSEGVYRVVVSNSFGTTISDGASLTVNPQNAPPLLAGPITNQANGHLYYLLATRSWVEAESAAVLLGGHLATVRSEAENNWIYATFGNYGGARRDLLVGLWDSYPLANSTNLLGRRGEFSWVSGEPITYTRWWTNEPNNYGNAGEFYGMIWGFGLDPSGYWNDTPDGVDEFNCGLAEVTLEPTFRLTVPTNRNTIATSSVSFSAVVTGLPPLAYKWYKDGKLLPDKTNRICTLVGAQASDAGSYTLLVSNAFGSVTGLVATLEVLPLTPPSVLAGPFTNQANDHLYYLLNSSAWVEAEAAAVSLGGHLATVRNQTEQDWIYNMFATYGGRPRHLHIGLHDPDPRHNSTIENERKLEFVWVSGEPVTYVNWHPTEPNNAWDSEFHVNMLNPAVQNYATGFPGLWNDQWDHHGHVASGVVEIIVSPSIAKQPTGQWTLPGSNVVFSVDATGSKPLAYQWLLNGTNLPGATSAVLSLEKVTSREAGSYVAVVSNSAGTVTSVPAVLDVRYLLAYGDGALLLESNYTFVGSVELRLWSTFPNGSVFYTLDGSKPSFNSRYYAGPIQVNRAVTFRAVAYSADFSEHEEAPPIGIEIVPTYSLTALTPGGGTVSVDPPTAHYPSNSAVKLTAIPSPGWKFLEWRGDASGNNPSLALTMNRNITVQALFGTSLATTVAGNGIVQVYPTIGLYPYGTLVRLTGIPQAGSYFAVWGNNASGSSNPLYLAVTNAGQTVSSLFAALGANQYSLSVIPNGFGRVKATPQANAYAAGASVSLYAVCDPGQEFLGWDGDLTGTENPLNVSMDTSKTITAVFTRKPSLAVVPPLGGLFETGFRFTLTGEFGGRYSIIGSSNHLDWLPLGTVTNTYGTILFTDPTATNLPTRFYRAF
jgi:hypothetical protein